MVCIRMTMRLKTIEILSATPEKKAIVMQTMSERINSKVLAMTDAITSVSFGKVVFTVKFFILTRMLIELDVHVEKCVMCTMPINR